MTEKKEKLGRCKFCGELTTFRYDFRFYVCDSDQCNKDLEELERELDERAREAAQEDDFALYR